MKIGAQPVASYARLVSASSADARPRASVTPIREALAQVTPVREALAQVTPVREALAQATLTGLAQVTPVREALLSERNVPLKG